MWRHCGPTKHNSNRFILLTPQQTHNNVFNKTLYFYPITVIFKLFLQVTFYHTPKKKKVLLRVLSVQHRFTFKTETLSILSKCVKTLPTHHVVCVLKAALV